MPSGKTIRTIGFCLLAISLSILIEFSRFGIKIVKFFVELWKEWHIVTKIFIFILLGFLLFLFSIVAYINIEAKKEGKNEQKSSLPLYYFIDDMDSNVYSKRS